MSSFQTALCRPPFPPSRIGGLRITRSCISAAACPQAKPLQQRINRPSGLLVTGQLNNYNTLHFIEKLGIAASQTSSRVVPDMADDNSFKERKIRQGNVMRRDAMQCNAMQCSATLYNMPAAMHLTVFASVPFCFLQPAPACVCVCRHFDVKLLLLRMYVDAGTLPQA